MYLVYLYNTTSNPITLSDIGVIIPATSYYEVRESAAIYWTGGSLYTAIENGTIVLNDTNTVLDPYDKETAHAILGKEKRAVDNVYDDTQTSMGVDNVQDAIEYLYTNGPGSEIAGASVEIKITQVDHAFTPLTPIYYNVDTSVWAKARANGIETLATHVVSGVLSSSEFKACQLGKIVVPNHGKEKGYWFTSDLVAGETISSSPDVSNPVFFVVDANTVFALSYRPIDTTYQNIDQTISGVKTFVDGIFSKVNTIEFETTGDGTYFLSNNGTYKSTTAGVDKEIQFNDGGVSGADSNLRFDKNTKSLYIGLPDTLSNSPLMIGGSLDNYLQLSIQNTSESPYASSDIVATADSGDDSHNYLDMGINSSVYAQDPEANDLSGPLDSYIAANGGNLFFFADTPGKVIKFVVDSTHILTVDTEGIKMVEGMVIENRPEVYYGTGSPPTAVGKADGTLFFKYIA